MSILGTAADDARNWRKLAKAKTTSRDINDPIEAVDPKFRITDIPRVMRDVYNWQKSAELMELWFSLPPREMMPDEKTGNAPMPLEYVNTTMFTWEWLEQFERVGVAEKSLKATLRTKASYDLIRERIVAHLGEKKVDAPTTITFPLDSQILHGNSQFQLKKIGLSHFKKVKTLFYPDQMDDLYGALGTFAIFAAITKCLLKPEKSPFGPYSIHIQEVGLYMRDTYDFRGPQYLGHWCDEGLKLSLEGGIDNFTSDEEFDEENQTDSKGDPIEPFGNSDFNEYRKIHHRGGDILLFSDVKKIQCDFSVNMGFDITFKDIDASL